MDPTPEHPGGKREKKHCIAVLRVGDAEPKGAEQISKELSRGRGVSKIELDPLKRVAIVEYDPERISLAEIRRVLGARARAGTLVSDNERNRPRK